MKRGEVWWADLGPEAKMRPVLLLSRDSAYRHRALVIVAPITTRIRSIPAEVLLTTAEGMPRQCAIDTDTITTIPKSDLINRVTTLSDAKLKIVDETLAYSIGLSYLVRRQSRNISFE